MVRRSVWTILVVVTTLAFSCATAPRLTEGDPTAERAALALHSLARQRPELATLVLPRPAAFVRAPNDAAEDPASRGRIVSEGWRATRARRFSELGARLPDVASEEMAVGVSRFDATHLRVRLVGASPTSGATLEQGRVTYVGALPSTDRVVVSNATSLEEFLVLHDARAPRAFSWTMDLPTGVARVRRDADALRFEDARGTTHIVVPTPTAYDARGDNVSLRVDWDDEARALHVAIDQTGPLSFPVIVDPRYETSVWFDTAQRVPSKRFSQALAFDSLRGEVVLFGGVGLGSVALNDTWVWSSGSWARRDVATPPTGRYGHAMAFDRARGEVVLFGGYGAAPLDDTWAWNGRSWRLLAPPASPSARSGHELAYDEASGKVLLFGGSANAFPQNDTWQWDGSAVTWTRLTPASSPPARAEHAMTFDSVRGQVVLFGGQGQTSLLGDTWLWNGATSTWTQSFPALAPSARRSHGLTFDTSRGEVLLFGGTSGAARNDTWAWNGASATWTQRAPAAPAVRSAHSLAFDGGRVVMFGGSSDNEFTGLNETWLWDGAATSWTQTSATRLPSMRNSHALAFDSSRGQVVLFGGSVNNTIVGDTWTWDGASWTQQAPTTAPAARSGHAMAYDSVRSEVVLFGGTSGPAFFDDTWAWDAARATWIARSSAVRPMPRFRHALAFDDAHGDLVLFGGFALAGGFLNDTWVWSAGTTSWAQRTPALAPSPRNGHALAYDADRGEVVLFGGANNTTLVNDTWVWAAGSWTQQMAPTSPGARSGHALGYDARSGVLLFGGDTGSRMNDTWVWNGTAKTWAQRSVASAPAPRWRHALAFDSARGQLVLFGGQGTGDLDDTWLHRTLGGTCTTRADCIDSAACVDGVCCNVSSCGSCETCAGTSPGRCTPVLNDEDPDTCALADKKSCSRLGECKTALGEPATQAAACASGNLVDGVCCASAVCGACQTCAGARQTRGEFPGRCSAAKAGTDLRDDCATEAVATCGHDGTCDGNGACALYGDGTPCGPAGAVCSGAGRCIVPAAASCDGDHTVVAPDGTRTDCGLYRCEGSTCKTACVSKSECTGNADCTPDHVCTAYYAPAVAGDGGGGCRVTPRDHGAGGGLALLALALVRRRLQRRARRRCNSVPVRRSWATTFTLNSDGTCLAVSRVTGRSRRLSDYAWPARIRE